MKKNLLLVVFALLVVAISFSSCVIERGHGHGHNNGYYGGGGHHHHW